MADRTARQQATITLMLDIASEMAAQTQRIARRDIVDSGSVVLSDVERQKLADALRHINQAAADLDRLWRREVIVGP